MREALLSGNVLSLYQGLGTKNVQSILSGFVYFYGYSFIRSKYLQHAHSSSLSLFSNIVVAAAAGACTVILTQVTFVSAFCEMSVWCQWLNTCNLCALAADRLQPWDTLSARMQTSRPGEAKSFASLLEEGGIRQAYNGLGISLLLIANPAIQVCSKCVMVSHEMTESFFHALG